MGLVDLKLVKSNRWFYVAIIGLLLFHLQPIIANLLDILLATQQHNIFSFLFIYPLTRIPGIILTLFFLAEIIGLILLLKHLVIGLQIYFVSRLGFRFASVWLTLTIIPDVSVLTPLFYLHVALGLIFDIMVFLVLNTLLINTRK